MTNRDDGGPAFPVQETSQFHAYPGMSLRDWLAGQVINGLVSESCRWGNYSDAAEAAYAIADAMLAERAKVGQP